MLVFLLPLTHQTFKLYYCIFKNEPIFMSPIFMVGKPDAFKPMVW